MPDTLLPTDPTPWQHSYPANVNWYASISPKPLTDLWDHSAQTFSNHPCLEFLGKRFTYKEVDLQIRRLTKGLQNLNITQGTRVGLFLPNCPLYVIAYFSILKAGGTVVNLNPLYVEREIVHLLNDSKVDTVITLDLRIMYEKLAPLINKTGLRRIIVGRMSDMLPFPKNLLFKFLKHKDIANYSSDPYHIPLSSLLNNDGKYTPVTVQPENDIAVLQYTGGTTGEPKGAMLTHANLSANAEQAALVCPGAKPGQEKMLCVIPFFHVFAMTAGMNLGLRLGAELIMLPRFQIDELMKTIDKKRPTMFPAVPTLYTAINTHKKINKYNLRSIRYCISGGAPLPLEVKRLFEKNTGCSLVEGYGLTEASPVVCVNPVDGLNKEGSIGLPLPRTVVQIRDVNDPHKILPIGERGELCVKGPQVMKGYWNKPAQTAEVFVDGFLRTGDVAYMDSSGYVFIVDRIKDLILCSGYNVYPRNVEEAIYLHSSVLECIVIGVPDSYRGQSVKAFIKLKSGYNLTADELRTFLKDKLSPIEMPKYIEFRLNLPKTLVGKLDRKALRQEEEQKLAAS